MHQSQSLLLNLTVCLAAALLCGYLATRLRFSPIVGYLVAGILCGQFTPGFVADPGLAEEMADIGIAMLMFGVGLHFNLHELFAVRKIAIPGAVVQSLTTTAAVMAASHLMGLTWKQGIIVGLAFSVASTAVLARMLADHKQLTTSGGRLAMGWLVVEDIFTVIVLVVLPMLATPPDQTGNGASLAKELGLALAKVAALFAIVIVFGMRLVPRVLGSLVKSREMFNLAVPVLALGVAWISAEYFSVSLALGSFLAGVVAGQSKLGEQIESTLGPVRDPFAALFFLSIGTLLDPHYVIQHPFGLLFALAVILLLKPLVTLLLMRVLRQSLPTTLVVAIGLAQVGEFSFILIHQANLLGLLPNDSGHLLVAAAIISITLNPFLFSGLPWIERIFRRSGMFGKS